MRQQSEQSEQSEQESPTQETLVNLFQNPDSPPRQPQLQVSDIQLPNPSETNTIHNTFEFSEETVQNTQSFIITDDSNLIIIPTHTISQTKLQTKIKTTLQILTQTIPLFYLHLILLLNTPLTHKYYLLEI